MLTIYSFITIPTVLAEESNGQEVIGNDTLYVETVTEYDALGNVKNYENILTKNDYDNYQPISMYTDCSDTKTKCWETNAKMLTLKVERDGNFYFATVETTWKTIPNIKSFDVTGLRFDTKNTLHKLEVEGLQLYDHKSINYDMNNQNVKYAVNGASLSTNIVDNVSSSLLIRAKYKMGFANKNFVMLYATYQHATSHLTLADSQNFTFNADGLGRVLGYNTTVIKNKYDGMQGVTLGFTPQYTIPDSTTTLSN